MISEGESNLVLNRDQFETIHDACETLFELLAELRDCYGSAKRGAWWGDDLTAHRITRRIMTQAANVNAAMTQARKLNRGLFSQDSIPGAKSPADEPPF